MMEVPIQQQDTAQRLNRLQDILHSIKHQSNQNPANTDALELSAMRPNTLCKTVAAMDYNF